MKVNAKIAGILVLFLFSTPTAWAAGPSPSPSDVDDLVSYWWNSLLEVGEEAIELVSVYVSDLDLSESPLEEQAESETAPCDSDGCLDSGDGSTQNLGGYIVPIG